jgi:hypothetical protein
MKQGEDNEKTFTLVGELKLENVNTYWFDTSSAIDDALKTMRMSVGWRNNQEDAYDIHSFRVKYNSDENKVEFTPEDGYCYGSIETQYYQIDGTATGVDQNGEYNSTIKQWTDNILPVDDKTYRVDETNNDITITTTSATPRPQNVIPDDVRQTFTVKYRKPFKATNVQDVNIQPLKEFNLTSYYGCYQDTTSTDFGVNPSVLYQQAQVTNPDDPEGDLIPGDFVGCQGRW